MRDLAQRSLGAASMARASVFAVGDSRGWSTANLHLHLNNLFLFLNNLFLPLLKTSLYTQTFFFLSLLKTSFYTQSFSVFTENLPWHPNNLFLSLLKTSLDTQTIFFCLYWKPPLTPKQSFSVFTENLPWHPNNLFLSLLKNLSLYPIFFCLYWKPPFTPKQYFSIFTENLPWHPNYLFLSLLKTSLQTQTLFFYLYWKPPFTPMQSLLKTSLNSHPNNIFSIFPENLPLYPIFFCLLVYSACRFVQHSFIGVYCSMERRGRYKGKKWMGRAFSSALLQQCQNTSWWSNDQSWAT